MKTEITKCEPQIVLTLSVREAQVVEHGLYVARVDGGDAADPIRGEMNEIESQVGVALRKAGSTVLQADTGLPADNIDL